MIYTFVRRKLRERKGEVKTYPPCEHRPTQPSGKAQNEEFLQDVETTARPPSSTEKAATSVQDTQLSGPCPQCKAAQKAMTKYRWKLVLGLFLPYTIATIDVTIVATALPFIATYFNEMRQLNWIVTAFTLTSTSFVPIYGQLSDVFGRHAVLQLTMVFIIIGSALGAGAQNFTMLLFGRAIQGVGSAGILNTIKIALADKVNLDENAKNNTLFSFIGGVAFAVGPVIGGYLTAVSWRWCFIINIPIALLAMVAIFVLLRDELVGPAEMEAGKSVFARLAVIDYGGFFLFIFGAGLLILGLTWGGVTYPWSSAHVLAPIVLGAVLFGCFFVYEYLMDKDRVIARMFPRQRAMIPFFLFDKRDLPLLAYISAATGAAMYSVFYFIAIFYTVVKSFSSSDAGIQLLYYIPGIGVGVYSAMVFCNFWPRQTWSPLFLGCFLEALGIGLLVWAIHDGRTGVVAAFLAVAGVGTGVRLMPTTLHVTGIWPDHIAAGMSLIDFCQPFGGTVALAIMGTVYTNKLSEALRSIDLSGSGVSFKGDVHDVGNLNAISGLPMGLQTQYRHAAQQAVQWAFISIVPILGLAVLAALALGNVRITKGKTRTVSGHLDTRKEVMKGPFLWYLIRGKR